MPKSLKPTLTIRIKGKTWKVYLLTCSQFVETFPKNPYALAYTVYNNTDVRRFYFRTRHIAMSTIRHELMHAYLSDRNFTGMSYGQIEEVVCDTVGAHLDSIRRLSRLLYKRLKKC